MYTIYTVSRHILYEAFINYSSLHVHFQQCAMLLNIKRRKQQSTFD